MSADSAGETWTTASEIRSWLVGTPVDPDEWSGDLEKCTHKTAVLAYHAIAHALHDPKKFIIEAAPAKPRQQKPGHILRVQDRPKYVILYPSEARQIMHLPQTLGGHKSAHERRGHFREYRSDYFVNRQGTRQWINPVWIGDSEAVVGHTRYRVCLDYREMQARIERWKARRAEPELETK